MMDKMEKKRTYHSFDPQKGYPAGKNLYYECTKCDDVIPSLPADSISCTCRNICIDVDYGRIAIKDHKFAKVFSEEKDT
jgi:hypothetical protein